ncbi:MAG: Hsp20/alpha crystallin family protein, partial [Candidatus Gracilibacteria bacterium]|nr:Hsp20/alpha crystallin family protein [Candidatus Gracilibacteria bacterium]
MFKLFGVSDKEAENQEEQEFDINILDEENEFFEDEIGQIALDILENEKEIILVAPIAGIEYDDIDITINKTVLTLKGYREKPQEYLNDEIIMRNSECFWGKFSRNIILPENLALNKIKAYMHNNMLMVT